VDARYLCNSLSNFLISLELVLLRQDEVKIHGQGLKPGDYNAEKFMRLQSKCVTFYEQPPWETPRKSITVVA